MILKTPLTATVISLSLYLAASEAFTQNLEKLSIPSPLVFPRQLNDCPDYGDCDCEGWGMSCAITDWSWYDCSDVSIAGPDACNLSMTTASPSSSSIPISSLSQQTVTPSATPIPSSSQQTFITSVAPPPTSAQETSFPSTISVLTSPQNSFVTSVNHPSPSSAQETATPLTAASAPQSSPSCGVGDAPVADVQAINKQLDAMGDTQQCCGGESGVSTTMIASSGEAAAYLIADSTKCVGCARLGNYVAGLITACTVNGSVGGSQNITEAPGLSVRIYILDTS